MRSLQAIPICLIFCVATFQLTSIFLLGSASEVVVETPEDVTRTTLNSAVEQAPDRAIEPSTWALNIQATRDDPSAKLVCNDMAVEISHDGLIGAQDSIASLQQNVSIAAFVLEEKYEFFQVCVANPPAGRVHSIFFEVVSLDGDADLYISTENEHPGKVSATWISADTGTDRITLRTNMDDYVAAREKLAHGTGLTLFIGVYGRAANAPTQGFSNTLRRIRFSIHIEISPYETQPPRGLLRGKYKDRFKKKPFKRPELPKHKPFKHN
jgi:hypothetical protein